MQKIREALIYKLNHTFSNEEIQTILDQVEAVLADYEVTERQTLPEVVDSAYYLKKFFEAKTLEGMKKTSFKVYSCELRDFVNCIGKALTVVKTQDIRDYLMMIKFSRNVTDRSLDHRRLVINNFYTWMQENGYVQTNPCKPIKRIKYISKNREPLTSSELARVRFACRNDMRESALIELLFCTGCRVSELVNIKLSDMDFYTKEIKVLGKGGKERTVYMNSYAEDAVRRYLDERKHPSSYLFTRKRQSEKDAPLSTDAVRLILKNIGERAKLNRVLHPHDMRHTTATYARDHSVPVEDIQSYLGHSNLDTTMIYIKLDKTRVKQNVQRCFA